MLHPADSVIETWFNQRETTNAPVGNHWVNRLLGNWQFAPLVHASSGQPLNVTTGKDNSLTGLGNDRPVQLMSNVYAASHGCSGAPCVQWINPAAFQPNALALTATSAATNCAAPPR